MAHIDWVVKIIIAALACQVSYSHPHIIMHKHYFMQFLLPIGCAVLYKTVTTLANFFHNLTKNMFDLKL